MKCKICSKEFYRSLSKIRAGTCSHKCGSILQQQKLRGTIVPLSRKLEISKTCKERGVGKWMKGRKNSKLAKMSKLQIKEKNPNWRGGITPLLQKRCCSKKWIEIRKKVYKRDNWTCQRCGKKCHNDIQCHHIIPENKGGNHTLKNLITLCKSCHIKEENKYIGHRRWNKDEWEKKPMRWTNIPVTPLGSYIR